MVEVLNSLIVNAGVVIYLLLLILALIRWRRIDSITVALTVYLALSLVWAASLAVEYVSFDIPSTVIEARFPLETISHFALLVALGALTPAFLSRKRILIWYATIGLLLVVFRLSVLIDYNDMQARLLSLLPNVSSFADIILYLTVITWIIASLTAPVLTLTSLRDRQPTQFRNRLRYWVAGMIILSMANLFILVQDVNLARFGGLLNIVGTLLISNIIMRSHLPDLHLLTSRFARTSMVTTTLSLIFLAALISAYGSGQAPLNRSIYQVLGWFAGASVILALILPRFSDWMETTFDKMLIDANASDEGSTLRAYSQSVSADWDFDKLGEQALSFILDEMKLKRGALFVNDGDGSGHVTLRMIASKGVDQEDTGYFFANDPWVQHMRQEQRSITQYDLNVLPEYKIMEENSKAWLSSMTMEIFVPVILRQRELMGILALGSKSNNRPYLQQELNRIDVLAAQIATDIDKAKLFNRLGSVNQKMGDMSRKFASLDKGKTDFLSIASHELRTPLTHIHGYASMLMEATEAELEDPAYLMRVFDGISKGSTRLKSVVDLIFDVSKAEIGKMELAPSPVNLANVVNEAADNQRASIEARHHKLVVSGINQLPIIQGSSQRLVQALEHLINNAIKYTPDGGTISITGRTTEENDSPHIELIITDTGIGIDPKEHTQIFDKFYRVGSVENHSTGNTKFKGAGPGLGLTLVSGIVQAHGGRIWVDSPRQDEENCPGSQFHIILPVNPSIPEIKEDVEADIAPSMVETRAWRSKDIEEAKERIVEQTKQP